MVGRLWRGRSTCRPPVSCMGAPQARGSFSLPVRFSDPPAGGQARFGSSSHRSNGGDIPDLMSFARLVVTSDGTGTGYPTRDVTVREGSSARPRTRAPQRFPHRDNVRRWPSGPPSPTHRWSKPRPGFVMAGPPGARHRCEKRLPSFRPAKVEHTRDHPCHPCRPCPDCPC